MGFEFDSTVRAWSRLCNRIDHININVHAVKRFQTVVLSLLPSLRWLCAVGSADPSTDRKLKAENDSCTICIKKRYRSFSRDISFFCAVQ